MRCGPGATGVACKATSTKTQRVICSYFSKPSDGLEPPTPPYYEREEGVDPSGIARSGAGSKCVEVSAFRRDLRGRATLVRPVHIRRQLRLEWEDTQARELARNEQRSHRADPKPVSRYARPEDVSRRQD